MKSKLLTFLILIALLASTASIAGAAADNGTIGVNVLFNTEVTDARLADIARFGKVREVIYEIDALTMQIKAGDLAAIQALPYVAAAGPDQERQGAPVDTVNAEDFLDGLSTWDLDAINVTDFDSGRTVDYDGSGVYVAVLDTGLLDSWRQYFPEERIAVEYARAFGGGGGEKGNVSSQPNKWEHDTDSHGTHVTSTILGYSLRGTPINGVAPMAKVIPVKVLGNAGWGWSSVVARGITYIADLKAGPLADHPVVINMSLGGPILDPMEKAAIDYAIEKGVIVVASAGNEGAYGMGYPGAYAPVISVAASGWTGEWTEGGWWLGDVSDPTDPEDFYITDFSSRELPGQDLDVSAPGSWVVGPYQLQMGKLSYYYLGGTSMASPHVAGMVALMAQKYPELTAPLAEEILEYTAVPLPPGCRDVYTPWALDPVEYCWGEDATGAGLAVVDDALDATEAPADFSVVSTNDFHGALVGRVHSWSNGNMVGSADYLAGYINIVREEKSDQVLYLDAGDAMQGTLISNYFEGSSTIDVFNNMGVAAMTLGNHEFDWGQEVLAEREAQAEFPFLAANLFYNNNVVPGNLKGERPSYAQPFVVTEVDGVKVGIIGVANPETPTITNPVHVADLDFTDPVAAVEENIPLVEAEGANMVIVLAHLGGFWPDFAEGIGDLACGLDPEHVDLIISGHTHSRIDDVICGIPVTQAYSSGTAFSRVDFEVLKASGEVLNYVMNYSPVSTYNTYNGAPAQYKRWDTGVWQTVVPDPVITGLVSGYEADIDAIKNEVIGSTSTGVTRDYRYESEMGDWVTDIMRAHMPGTDFAFTNSGGLRADIDVGEITFGEIFEVMPFDNTNVIVDLTGDEVRQVLEEGISGAHGVIQVSGLSFAFDYDAPVGSRIIGDVINLSTSSPLEASTIYKVAVNDFMASGGDEYFTLAAAPQVNTYALIRDLLVDWVKANSPFTPPDPALEMRIAASGTPPS
ncbi:MAG: S8 family serine peptidase [Chloroflexota bacterium]|nr:MAG: S8 family serine peptidase [Chloroflexota bacterium]